MGFLASAIDLFRLEPMFGPKAWRGDSTCDDVHPHGPIPDGSKCCCMACHVSGRDRDRRMKITPADEAKLAAWKPNTPDGRDQWSPVIDKDVEIVMVGTKKAKKQRQSVRARTMDPDHLNRLIESGRAVHPPEPPC